MDKIITVRIDTGGKVVIILSIRFEEIPLFLVLLIHINTHNRMEINL